MSLVLLLPPISIVLVYITFVFEHFSVGMGVMRPTKIASDHSSHHQITAMPEANYNSFVSVSPCYICDRDRDNEN